MSFLGIFGERENVKNCRELFCIIYFIKANSISAISNLLVNSFGPNGLDKMIESESEIIISKKGSKILESLEIEHPICQIVIDSAKQQNKKVIIIL